MNTVDNVGNFSKFVCPTIANGKVYLAYDFQETKYIWTACFQSSLYYQCGFEQTGYR